MNAQKRGYEATLDWLDTFKELAAKKGLSLSEISHEQLYRLRREGRSPKEAVATLARKEVRRG